MSTVQSEHLISLLDSIAALHPEERVALALLAIMYAPVARLLLPTASRMPVSGARREKP